MRHILITFALLFATMPVAWAQGPPASQNKSRGSQVKLPASSSPLTGSNSNGSFLLARKAVQADLKLTPSATTQVEAICTKLKSDTAANQAELKAHQKPATPNSELYAAANTQLSAILDKDQNARLRQIYLQQRGVYAIEYTDVQQEIGLQPAQVSQLESLFSDWRDTVQKLNADLKAGTITNDQRSAQIKDGGKALMKSLSEIPTPAQHQKLIDIEGPQFKPSKE